MAPRRARTWVALIVTWIVRIVFAVILGFPFYWMLITTFKRTSDLYNLDNNPFIFNERPTLEHLRLLFTETLFLRWVGNTVFAGAPKSKEKEIAELELRLKSELALLRWMVGTVGFGILAIVIRLFIFRAPF